MIKVRLYSFVLSIPSILVVSGMITFFSSLFPANANWIVASMLFVVGIVIQAVISLSIKCPECSKSPYTSASGAFGHPWPDETCSRCGFDLAGTK